MLQAWRPGISVGIFLGFPCLVVGLAGVLFVGSSSSTATAQAQDVGPPEVTVYMSRTCGCCKKWVNHLEENGFKLITLDVANLRPVKDSLNVPVDLASCHTAVVEGYVIEGHVPADLIHRLLDQRSDVTGLAVPGMPIGSPGMEGPDPVRYEVMSFHEDGRRSVYATREPVEP